MHILRGMSGQEFIARFDALALRLADITDLVMKDSSLTKPIAEISARYGSTAILSRFSALRDEIRSGEVSEISGSDENDLNGLRRATEEMEAVANPGLSTGTVILIGVGVMVGVLGIIFLTSMAETAGVGAGTRIVTPRVQLRGRRIA